MLFYLVIISIFVIYGFLSIFDSKLLSNKYIKYIILLSVSIISGLRFKTGTDWDAYYNLFYAGNNISSYINYYHFDLGYKLFNWLIHNITNNYNIFLFIQSLIVLFVKFSTFKQRPYYYFSFIVLMGLSLFDLFPTRQYISISIIILSAYLVIRKRYLITIILLILAFSIHKMALIVLPFFFIFNKIKNLKPVPFIGIFSAIVFYLLIYEMSRLQEVKILSYYVEQSKYYISLKTQHDTWESLYYLLFSIVVFKLYKNLSSYLNNFEKYSVKFFYFSLFFRIALGLIGNNILLRASWFFSGFEIIAVSSLSYFFINCHKTKLEYTSIPLYYFLFVMFYFTRFIINLRYYKDLYIPFETVFSESYKKTY